MFRELRVVLDGYTGTQHHGAGGKRLRRIAKGCEGPEDSLYRGLEVRIGNRWRCGRPCNSCGTAGFSVVRELWDTGGQVYETQVRIWALRNGAHGEEWARNRAR